MCSDLKACGSHFCLASKSLNREVHDSRKNELASVEIIQIDMAYIHLEQGGQTWSGVSRMGSPCQFSIDLLESALLTVSHFAPTRSSLSARHPRSSRSIVLSYKSPIPWPNIHPCRKALPSA